MDFNTDYSKYYFLHENEFPLDTRDIILVTGIDPRESNHVHQHGKLQKKKKKMMVSVVIIVTNFATYEQIELCLPCYKPSYALHVIEL